MSYTLISEIDELVSEKQTMSRGVNDNMNNFNTPNSRMQSAREMIETMPPQAIQRRFQPYNPQIQTTPSYNTSYQNDMQYNQYPTKSLRKDTPAASLFEKTPIMTVMNEETKYTKTKEKLKHKSDDDDEEEDEDENKKSSRSLKMIAEMNTNFVNNINVMNDNILMLYKKVHTQDMMLKAIVFMLVIILILVLRK